MMHLVTYNTHSYDITTGKKSTVASHENLEAFTDADIDEIEKSLECYHRKTLKETVRVVVLHKKIIHASIVPVLTYPPVESGYELKIPLGRYQQSDQGQLLINPSDFSGL